MKEVSFLKKIYYFLLAEFRLLKKQKEFQKFKELHKNSTRFNPKWEERFIYFNDDTSETSFDTHYIYHPAWATRIVKSINPVVHVDISSTLAFSSTLSAFVPVNFFDYRPANLILSNLQCGQTDLTKLSFKDNSIHSLSCMHVIEHIGLGRYGDPMDPEGDLKAISELKRVLAPGGNLLIVVPVGKQRIQWNAHRIYSYESIVGQFEKGFKIKEFVLIPDSANKIGMILNAKPEITNSQNYGCGCWWISKDDNV